MRPSVFAALVVLGSVQCKPAPVCSSTLVAVNEPIGDLAALPEVASLEDVGAPKRSGGCSEYDDEAHVAKLGPFRASYDAMDYKGQTVTTNATLTITDGACPGGVTFVMETRGVVRLRRDDKRDLWIVSNLAYADRAVAFRRVAHP